MNERRWLVALVVIGCGRTSTSGLEENPVDAAAAEEPGSDATVPARDASGGTACAPETCPVGCCSADGLCIAPSTSQCGGSGTACVACPAGAICKGTCLTRQVHCDPTNCPGCCAGPLWCASGNSDYQCGTGGQQCQACVPSEGTGACAAQDGGGGLCNAVQSCDSTNCTGCCDGDVCRPGTYDAACGSGGGACTACPTGQRCAPQATATVGYACQQTSACTLESCTTGCCDGKVCAVGTQDIACGSGGEGCDDCTFHSPALRCIDQQCQ